MCYDKFNYLENYGYWVYYGQGGGNFNLVYIQKLYDFKNGWLQFILYI